MNIFLSLICLKEIQQKQEAHDAVVTKWLYHSELPHPSQLNVDFFQLPSVTYQVTLCIGLCRLLI